MNRIRTKLWPALGMLGTACLLGGCFLKGRSVLHTFHPDAEVVLESSAEGRYSPDGRHLAFVRLEGGKSWTADVYVLDLETEIQHRVTANPDYDGQPSWSPDSRFLVYTSRRKGMYNLYLTTASGAGERQLTWAGGRQPDFSPDGVSIVYTGDESGSLDLFLTSPSGGISRRLTEEPGREWFPRYSPDGRYIAYVSNQGGSDDLWLMDRKSESRTRLTDGPADEIHPAWSPDSRMLVFSSSSASSRDSYRLDLFALAVRDPPAAGTPAALTSCEGMLCQSTFPSFSPDGRMILFTAEFNPLQPRIARLPVEQQPLAALLEQR